MISDNAWELIKPHTIRNKGTWGGNACDTRLFINAVFWILRTGAPWRDLPPDYGNWTSTRTQLVRIQTQKSPKLNALGLCILGSGHVYVAYYQKRAGHQLSGSTE